MLPLGAGTCFRRYAMGFIDDIKAKLGMGSKSVSKTASSAQSSAKKTAADVEAAADKKVLTIEELLMSEFGR